MNLNTKVRLLQGFNHIVTIPAVVYAVYTQQYYLFAIAAISWLIIGPISSVITLHRLLTHSDREGDPHSSWADGKFNFKEAIKVWLGYDWKVPAIPVRYIKDLMRSPTHKFIFKNYFKIIFAFSAVLLLIDPALWLFAYVVPASMTVHLIGVVNVLGHYHGYRNHETKDHSSNSWIANIVSLGEGWHNNHHAKPANYHTGEKWWEWDLMGSLIKLIKID